VSVRAGVRRGPGEDCVVMWKNGDLVGWKGFPLRGAPSQESWLVTGARVMVGCSEGFFSKSHLHPRQ